MASITSTLTGGLIGDAPDYSALAKRSEARRKGIINLGMEQINALYGGGTAPFYPLANAPGARFDPHQTYYHLGKKGSFQPYWVPKGQKPSGQFHQSGIGQAIGTGGFDIGAAFGAKAIGLDKLFGSEESPKDIARKQFRRGQLVGAPQYQTFTGFNEPFYQARQKAYLDYALPQANENYRAARDAQLYAIANRGLLGSTQQAQGQSGLNRALGQNRQQIADEAVNQRNQLERSIEDARQASIQQLYQSADPAQAFSSAIRTAQGFERPSTFVPIANSFSNLLAQYYNDQLNQKVRAGFPNVYGGGDSYGNYLAPI